MAIVDFVALALTKTVDAYRLPTGGIPETDLDSNLQSLIDSIPTAEDKARWDNKLNLGTPAVVDGNLVLTRD